MADEEIKPVVDFIEINDIPNILEEGIPEDAEYDSYNADVTTCEPTCCPV